ncbi:unnamed protein product, partial [Laminaria digitata]
VKLCIVSSLPQPGTPSARDQRTCDKGEESGYLRLDEVVDSSACMSSDRTSTDLPPGTNTTSVIPPLGERSTPTSAVTKRPLFGPDGPRGVVRPQPAPPAGPPPKRIPSDLADPLEMRLPLPDISQQGEGAAISNVKSNDEKGEAETASSAENQPKGEAYKRIDSMGR